PKKKGGVAVPPRPQFTGTGTDPSHAHPRQHLLPLRAELRARLPLGPRGIRRDAVADREQELEVLHRAGEVPVRLHLVTRLVVVVRGVLVTLLLAVLRRLADVFDAVVRVERRHALLRELEVV